MASIIAAKPAPMDIKAGKTAVTADVDVKKVLRTEC
jgi:hypothetical protein